VALQHNVGLGGAGVVTILRRADGQPNRKKSDQEIAQISGVGYNLAVEARGCTAKQAESIMARDRSDWMFKYDEEENKRKQNSSI
jgi:sterol carrier protein 2